MKVSISYSNGRYYMTPAEPRQPNDGDIYRKWYEAGLVEIGEDEWAEYQLFVSNSNRWHQRLCNLDNMAEDQRNAKLQND